MCRQKNNVSSPRYLKIETSNVNRRNQYHPVYNVCSVPWGCYLEYHGGVQYRRG